MSGQNEEQLKTLEEALKQLAPQPPTLARDRVMFEAGRASARPARAWPLATAAATLTALVLAAIVLFRVPVPQAIERTVLHVEKPPAAVAPPPTGDTPPRAPRAEARPFTISFALGDADYLNRRREVLRWGVDMLPAPPPRSSGSGSLLLSDRAGYSDRLTQTTKILREVGVQW